MKGVDTRVEGAHYFARVFLEDKERFDSCLIVVRENENPTEVLEKNILKDFKLTEFIQFKCKN